MSKNPYQITTAKENLELVQEANSRVRFEWPEFMLHDEASALFPELYTKVPAFQFVVVDPDTEVSVALGNSIPLQWQNPIDDLPIEGWDWAIRKGIDDFDNERQPNLLCALQIVVFSKYRGKGISQHGVEAMRRVAHRHGLERLIAPVRPSAKSDHPLVDIFDYVTWQRADGLPLDPWLRVHAKAGARIVKPCVNAMRIEGSVDEWQQWTGMTFDSSGNHIVPGALTPVAIDIERDSGVYIEPNVWMAHSPVSDQ